MRNLIFAFNAGSIFIEIFLPKSKPVLSGILYRPPDKYDFINYHFINTYSATLISLNLKNSIFLVTAI